jgi:hypothetical protein
VGQDSFSAKDFGIDLPLGGLGNPVPRDRADQLFIGPSGTPYKQTSNSPAFVKEIQHGHLFVGMYEFGFEKGMGMSLSPFEFDENSTPATRSRVSVGTNSVSSFASRVSRSAIPESTFNFVGSMLIGIESSAPLKTDFFGKKHGLDGASKILSAFGKQKWRNYELSGLCIPKAQGGIRMDVDPDRLLQLEQIFSQLDLGCPSDRYQDVPSQNEEKHLFRQLLQSSASEAALILDNCFDFSDGQSGSVEEAELWRSARTPVACSGNAVSMV